MSMSEPEAAVGSVEIRKFNLDIAERVRQLAPDDLVSVLTGRASSLIAADDNQNQNQNGAAARIG
jgi:hypothetical protein